MQYVSLVLILILVSCVQLYHTKVQIYHTKVLYGLQCMYNTTNAIPLAFILLTVVAFSEFRNYLTNR